MKRLVLIVICFLSLAVMADNKKIALLEPRVGEGSTDVSGMEKAMIRGELRKAIVNHTGYEAFSRSDIDQMMKEQDFQRTGNVSDGDIHRLGEMTGADFICVATITKSASEFYIEAYLINIESGGISNPASQYGELINGKLGNMLPVCQALAQELLGTLSPMVSTITSPSPIVPSMTTPSTTTTTTPSSSNYEVYEVINGYTVCGNRRDYTDEAQALATLAEAVNKWEEVRTGDITENGNGLMIYKNNGYQFQGCDFGSIKDKVSKYNNDGERISDVAINKLGHYVIIRGDYGYGSSGLPSDFLDALKERNEDKDKILSVALDDADNWVYVTEKYYRAKSETDQSIISEATNMFGHVQAVSITTKGIVVCCANGVLFKGIPKNLAEKILSFVKDGHRPKVVKFTDSGTFLITDGESAHRFYM